MNILKTCAAVLLGFVLGAAIYHPKPVRAAGGVYVDRVNISFGASGASFIPAKGGNRVVGFACTTDSCYLVSETP